MPQAAADLDQAAVEVFAEKVFGDVAGAHTVFMARFRARRRWRGVWF
jgi:hypothetical protein